MIETAIQDVLGRGIRLVRGPTYVREGGRVVAVDWCGAVLVHVDGVGRYGQPGWLRWFSVDILDRNPYWFMRFNFGFSQGRALQLYREDKKEKGKRIYYDDSVSLSGSQLARRHGLYPSDGRSGSKSGR